MINEEQVAEAKVSNFIWLIWHVRRRSLLHDLDVQATHFLLENLFPCSCDLPSCPLLLHLDICSDLNSLLFTRSVYPLTISPLSLSLLFFLKLKDGADRMLP